MDKDLQKGLSDRVYDKRKQAAIELEHVVRHCLSEGNHERIRAIIDDLCRNYAYAVHHPNSRNGGLIGLAAAAIALGQNELVRYLDDIIHPVLACFGDQDARVRYYACESMYNIAKVAKGEILVYFNEIFDALCRLATDTEPSVKSGADLLDRLIKDIVAEKAATYVSIVNRKAPSAVLPSLPLTTTPTTNEENVASDQPVFVHEEPQNTRSFSLEKFVPLLMERIYVMNPFARMFLVSWITLLDSIPALELLSHLPSFLGGLLTFLSDTNKDVRVATHTALDGFANEIRRVMDIKKTVRLANMEAEHEAAAAAAAAAVAEASTSANNDDNYRVAAPDSGIYIPGQDVEINFDKIVEILISHLDSSDEEIQIVVLNWMETILEVSPRSILECAPRFLSVLLPTMACDGYTLRHAAEKVNDKLVELIRDLPDDKPSRVAESETTSSPPPIDDNANGPLDYSATVNALTLHFLNEKEQTRVAALDWLIMLQKKMPRKILAVNDGTFPALLKTLSDPSDEVITKDLRLLAQISYNSSDEHFSVFMVNLLNLFSTDRRLLETRGKLIIRQLCISLNPERIYRILADILEKDDDVEFASMMVLNLNNNLITAPELANLRTRLRSLDTRDGASLFVALFKSWCHNSVAALSLCLLAQAYQHAFAVLQIIVEFEITVDLLVQVDRLVQLLESSVFTRLRLQLLEPEKYPYLYKVLYGILMLLPQSSAFDMLKNRLNSVSAIGYVHLPQSRGSNNNNSSLAGILGSNSGSNNDIRWTELLDKFRSVQNKLQAVRTYHARGAVRQETPPSRLTSPLSSRSELANGASSRQQQQQQQQTRANKGSTLPRGRFAKDRKK